MRRNTRMPQIPSGFAFFVLVLSFTMLAYVTENFQDKMLGMLDHLLSRFLVCVVPFLVMYILLVYDREIQDWRNAVRGAVMTRVNAVRDAVMTRVNAVADMLRRWFGAFRLHILWHLLGNAEMLIIVGALIIVLMRFWVFPFIFSFASQDFCGIPIGPNERDLCGLVVATIVSIIPLLGLIMGTCLILSGVFTHVFPR